MHEWERASAAGGFRPGEGGRHHAGEGERDLGDELSPGEAFVGALSGVGCGGIGAPVARSVLESASGPGGEGELYREKYGDYGPTLAAECLAAEDGDSLPVETLRGWLLAAGGANRVAPLRTRSAPPPDSAVP
ncbi:MAG TPA: hypothetical protein PLS55_13490 [Thermogutta sp.]|nr:hypothetical protein [Thermogutta sp.]